MHSPVISPAVRTGFLDLFSIGALLSGICLLAVTSPARLQRLTRLGQRLPLPRRRPSRSRRARSRRAAPRRALPRHASTLGRPVGRHAASSRYSPAGR
jgi:hypothetical protein